MTIFLAGCAAADKDRIAAAAEREARARAVAAALETTRLTPDQPADCNRREHAGVGKGDRLDVVVVKYDAALGRANDRVQRCYRWREDVARKTKGQGQ